MRIQRPTHSILHNELAGLFGGGGGGGGSISSTTSALSDHNATATALSSGAAQVGLSIYQTERAGQFAKDQRSWQEGLANTAYQRAVLDMKQAGINPILAYKQGGATTPGGGMASPANFSGIAETAMKGARLHAELAQIKSSTKERDAGTAKLKTAAALDKIMGKRVDQEMNTSAAQMNNINIQTELAKTNLPGAQLEAQIDQSTYGKVLRYINRFSNSVLGAARSLFTGKANQGGTSK